MTSEQIRRSERRSVLEEVLEQHTQLQQAVAIAQGDFDDQDRKVRQSFLNPTGDYVDYQAEDERLRSLKIAVDRAKSELAHFERVNDLDAARAELKTILAEEDADARAAARREAVEMMMRFDEQVLRPAEARWAEIRQRLIEIENRWPGQRVVVDLPHLVDGIFYPHGTRSICTWYREVMCAAEPELFDPDDPVRQKIDAMRAKGAIRIYFPLPLEWRL
jgi:hypothetical protein